MVNRIGLGQMTSISAEKGRVRASMYQAMHESSNHSGNVDEPNTRRRTKRRDRKQIKNDPKIKTRGRVIGIGHFAASRPANTNSMRVGLSM